MDNKAILKDDLNLRQKVGNYLYSDENRLNYVKSELKSLKSELYKIQELENKGQKQSVIDQLNKLFNLEKIETERNYLLEFLLVAGLISGSTYLGGKIYQNRKNIVKEVNSIFNDVKSFLEKLF